MLLRTVVFYLVLAMAGAFHPLVAKPFEPIGPSSRRTGLIISEIMYHPPMRADGREVEFVELYNSQTYPEDLSDYRLTGDISFVFPKGTTLASGSYLVVARN